MKLTNFDGLFSIMSLVVSIGMFISVLWLHHPIFFMIGVMASILCMIFLYNSKIEYPKTVVSDGSIIFNVTTTAP